MDPMNQSLPSCMVHCHPDRSSLSRTSTVAARPLTEGCSNLRHGNTIPCLLGNNLAPQRFTSDLATFYTAACPLGPPYGAPLIDSR